MKEERLEYIDILKFIAAVMIVSLHFSIAGKTIDYNNISLLGIMKKILVDFQIVGVPLFFMVNGALLLNKQTEEIKILDRIKKVLLQYLFWTIITNIIIIKFYNLDVFKYNYLTILSSMLFGTLPGVDMSHLWFIKTLIAIYFLIPFIYPQLNKNSKEIKVLFIVLLVVSFVIPSICFYDKTISVLGNLQLENLEKFYPIMSPVNVMLSYFIIGYLLEKYQKKVLNIKYKYLILILFVSFLLLEVNCYLESKYLKTTISGVYAEYNGIPSLLICSTFYIIIMKYFTKHQIMDKAAKYFASISKNTITVYYLDWILGYTVLSSITLKVMSIFNLNSSVLFNYIRALVIVTVLAYIGKISKKIPIIKNIF